MTYKTIITIDDPDRVTLSNVPFHKGQKVRVVILPEPDQTTEMSQALHQLFRETQALLGVDGITEAEISDEIAAYRRGE